MTVKRTRIAQRIKVNFAKLPELMCETLLENGSFMIVGEPFMNLKLIAVTAALTAIPALAHAQQGSPQPNVAKPTKADVQNVVQIVTNDKAKTQAYCDLTKLYNQVEAAQQKNDTKAVESLVNQSDALVDKLGPEYSKMIEGLEEVDLTSSEGKEFMAILSGLDKLCTR
jgi:hypothetical protein